MLWIAYVQTREEVVVLGEVEGESFEIALVSARRRYSYPSHAVIGVACDHGHVPSADMRRMHLGWRYVNSKGRGKLKKHGVCWT